jgi:hypothetical protein
MKQVSNNQKLHQCEDHQSNEHQRKHHRDREALLLIELRERQRHHKPAVATL